MTTGRSEAAVDTAAAKFTRSWRYRLGLALILAGHAILLVAILLPVLGFGLGLAGVLAILGEIVCGLSIVVLGLEGFQQIKKRILGAARAAFVAPVGRTRHRVGISLICINLVALGLVEIHAVQLAARATSDAPIPTLPGLTWSLQNELVIGLVIGGEAAFVAAIYVLGADWWDRFRNLFIWNPPVAKRRA